jgi:hypothetical protein
MPIIAGSVTIQPWTTYESRSVAYSVGDWFGWESLPRNVRRTADAKLVATARGVQVTGVLLCLANGDDLTRCQCFIDLALTETKTRVKKVLVAAMTDWTGLAAFPPKDWLVAA